MRAQGVAAGAEQGWGPRGAAWTASEVGRNKRNASRESAGASPQPPAPPLACAAPCPAGADVAAGTVQMIVHYAGMPIWTQVGMGWVSGGPGGPFGRAAPRHATWRSPVCCIRHQSPLLARGSAPWVRLPRPNLACCWWIVTFVTFRCRRLCPA